MTNEVDKADEEAPILMGDESKFQDNGKDELNHLVEELAKMDGKIESDAVLEKYSNGMMPDLIPNEPPVRAANTSPSKYMTRNGTPIEDGEEVITFYSAEEESVPKYPQDCYSFIALYGPDENGWSRERFLFFLFGLFPFAFQMMLIVLLSYSETNELRGTIGENDNPDKIKEGVMALLAKVISANSTPIIRVAQVVSLGAYVLFPNSCLRDIVKAVRLFPVLTDKQTDGSVFWLRVACFLRLVEGIAATAATLLLVLNSTNVVGIILNFKAMHFVSKLDEDAFVMALSGDFGAVLESEAKDISETDLPKSTFKTPELRLKCFRWVIVLVYLFFVTFLTFVFASQNSKSVWVTDMFRVQFRDSRLNEYSGCFEMNQTSGSVAFSRRTYHSFDTGDGNDSTLAYCRRKRQWVIFKGSEGDPCDAYFNKTILLARSSKTDTFDISTVFHRRWVSESNTPLSLYFIGEKEAKDSCDFSLGDGKCDDFFNKLGYDFDGGDCCAATCTKSNCGRGGLTSVFGNTEVSGDGYENCVDPSMVPITIHLNHMTSSRDPLYTGWYQWDNVTNAYDWNYDEDQFIEWMEAEPLSTYFSLDCNGQNVMTAYVDKSMVNQSQTVMVEDGARCSLVVRNRTSAATDGYDDINDDPIWYIDYTIFHSDDAEILSNDSFEEESVEFTRIAECLLAKKVLGTHVDYGSMYTGHLSSSQAIGWLMEDLDPRQCEDSDFLERYALVNMNFAMNATELFITRDELCRWKSIRCNNGKVDSAQLQRLGLQGKVPTEFGLMSSLRNLHLDNNQLTSLPTEIGNLIHLEKLNLDGNIKLASVPTEIGNLSRLQELHLVDNMLASVPPEIRDLVRLQELWLGFNELISLPTEIGTLSRLQDLDLWGNQLTSVPTEIGNLLSLAYLDLDENNLTSLPNEIGNLTNLEALYLSDNLFQSLPSEIGNLSNLISLWFDRNEFTSLPTELWNLSSLQHLALGDNKLTSLSREIGNLTNLETLYLSGNLFESLPSEIGNLSNLGYLYLTGNLFESLPSEIGNLSNLTYLEYDANVQLSEEVILLCSSSSILCTTNQDTMIPSLFSSTLSPSDITEEREEDTAMSSSSSSTVSPSEL